MNYPRGSCPLVPLVQRTPEPINDRAVIHLDHLTDHVPPGSRLPLYRAEYTVSESQYLRGHNGAQASADHKVKTTAASAANTSPHSTSRPPLSLQKIKKCMYGKNKIPSENMFTLD